MTSSCLRARLISKLFRRALRPANWRSRPVLQALECRLTPTATYPDIVMPRPIYDPLAISLPPGFDDFVPPIDAKQTVAASSPIISEFTRSAGANHTIALTGHQLTSFGGSEKGKDTDFIVYGLLDGSATTISHADVLRADNVRAAITLPDNLFDNQMYLVWPRTAAGVGRPVAVNQAAAQWAGPDKASAGETVSIFGENLVRIGTDDAKVWIEPADGSSNYYSGWVEATGNPYKIDFTLPTGAAKALAQFSNLWAHNFHGGDSGWSPPVTIEVRPSLPTTVSTAGEFPVDKYGAKAGDGSDDYTAITDAIAAARKHTNDYPGEGATVQFGKGAYSTSLPLSLGGCVNISFEGTADLGLPATVIEAIPDKAGKRPVAVVFTDNNFANVRFRDIEFNDNKNLASIYSGPDLVLAAVLVRLRGGQDVSFDNCNFVADQWRLSPLDLDGSSLRVKITNCDFLAGQFIELNTASQVQVDGCDFRAVWDCESLINLGNSAEISVTNCTGKDANPDAKTKSGEPDIRGFGRGRLLRAASHFNENIFIAHNVTTDFAPKFGAIAFEEIHDYNEGEQILFEPAGATVYGRPSVVDSESVTIVGLETDYLTTYLTHLTATVIDGTGVGQRRKVTAIDGKSGKVSVSPHWNVNPDAYSQIAIAPTQQNVVIYDNTLEGKEEWLNSDPTRGAVHLDVHVASAGVQIGGVAHVLVVGNTISDVRQGVYFTPTQRNVPSGAGADPRPQFDTDYFNYIARNTITRSTKGVAIETYRNGAGVAPVGYGSAALATVVRENDFSLFEIATTFNSTYRNYVIGVDADWQYRAADLTIFEDNTYFTGGDPDAELTGVRTFSGFSGTTFDTIIRNNHFEGLPDAATSVNFAPQGSPGLFDNQWNSKSKVYAGSVPGMVLELPTRVVRLAWDGNNPTATDPHDVTVRNAGVVDPWAVSDFWVTADADWLVVGGVGVPESEGSNESLYVAVNPDKMALLGNGVYRATVTITDGSWSISPVTVEVTVTNHANTGPHGGVLPDLRHDEVVQIEAEHYDLGGKGVGFYDPNGDDHVEPISGGFAVVDPPAGNWYNYTVNVPADGWYRAELRMRGAGSVKLTDHGVEFVMPADNAWRTIRPGGGTEEFVYLSYGVQVLSFEVVASNGLDIDWLRLSPVDATTQAGISLPYPAPVPTISQFANTTVETEHYDKGGIGVGYSDNWSSNGLADFRTDEQVAVTNAGTVQQPAYAVRGPAGRWVQYTVDVTTPGKYQILIRASNASGSATQLSLRDAADNVIGNVTVPYTGGFAYPDTVSILATFLSIGRKTLRLRFTSGETQVHWLKFLPADMSLIGPQMPQPAAPQSKSAGTITHVGTAFAVNAEGTISSLRYFVNSFELIYSRDNNLPITLRLWRVNSASQNPSDGQITYVADPNPLCDPVTLQLSGTQGAWFTAAIPGVFVSPGLYMVSANVNTSYSISTIPTGATPGALTLVAGTITRSPTAVFPSLVHTETGFPTAYLWMDITFNPSY